MGQDAVLWLGLGVALQSLFTLLTQLLIGMSRFAQLTVGSVLLSVGRLIVVIPLYKVYGIAGITAGLAIAAGMGCILSLWQLRDVVFSRETNDYGFVRIINLSWPFYLESYLMYFRSAGDQLAVTGILGAEALAQYYVARRLYDLLKVLSDSVDSVLIPALSRLSLESSAVFVERWRSLFRAGLAIGVPVSLISAAAVPFYLSLLGAEKFSGALMPGIILCMVFIVDILKGVVINRSVFVLCPPVKRLQITMFEAAMLLPMVFAGTYFLGAAGAALSTLISGAGAGVYAYRVLRKVLQVKVSLHEWSAILLPAIVSFTLMVVVIAGIAGDLHAGALRLGISTILGITIFVLLYINLISIELMDLLVETLGGGRLGALGTWLMRFRIRWG
jgi:O-antigen/teichoic acid export membrane protein